MSEKPGNGFKILRIAEAIAVFVAITAFVIDLSDRQTDRAIREAALMVELSKSLAEA